MKEIRETKLVEQTTVRFIANDGTEFMDEQECIIYERRLNKEKLEKEYKKLNPIEITIPFLDWDPMWVTKITLKTEADFDTVVDYFESTSRWMDTCGLTENKPAEFPATMLIANGEEWVNVPSETVEDVKRDLLKAYEQLGGKLNEVQ